MLPNYETACLMSAHVLLDLTRRTRTKTVLLVLRCTTVGYYRGTAAPFFYGTSTVAFTALFSTAIPQVPRFFGTVLVRY